MPPTSPSIMGILNVTPDSFSGGLSQEAAIAAGRAMVAAGADILDIGGESTRPGAVPVLPAEEQARILPVIAALRDGGVPISVDTRNASTMAAALAAGASIINDVSALRHDPASAALVAARQCPVVLMHMRGSPQTMAGYANYGDLVAEVCAELLDSVALAAAAGVLRDNIILDPGIGFAKTGAQNLALLQGLARVVALGFPVLVGVSRKRFIGEVAGVADPLDRLPGSLAAGLFAISQGAAILRVHDVGPTVQGLRVWGALAG